MLKVDISKRIQSESGTSNLCFSAKIEKGSMVGIFGNSGEGKSSVLNMISGSLKPDIGTIHFNNTIWADPANGIYVPIQNRKIGYIFQENSLFPHFTVKQNILYAIPKKEQPAFDILLLLKQVGLSKMQDRYPSQLSGGQIQRAVIARTLAQRTNLILMDEPFSGLDMEIKLKLYKQIKELQESYGLTIILVTHDVEDIYNLCNDVYWIENHTCNSKLSKQEFKNVVEEKIKSI